jgi:hypothetical protein
MPSPARGIVAWTSQGMDLEGMDLETEFET